jgi:long-chain acyl-CoA synthetase
MQLEELAAAALDRAGDARAIQYKGTWFTWSWMHELAAQTQAHLTKSGIAPNARVGIVARNNPAFVAAFLSLIASRRTVVMIHPLQSSSAIAGDLPNLSIEALVADDSFWSEELLAASLQMRTLGLAIDTASGTSRIVSKNIGGGSITRAPPLEPSIEFLTSGTTGRPKRFPMGFDLIGRAMINESSMRNAQTDAPPVLVMFPFGNISGVYSYLPTLQSGQSVVLLDKFTVLEWVQFVQTYEPAIISLPTAGVRMVLDANVSAEQLASVRFITSGASSLDPKLQSEFTQRYNIPILLSYGATEFGGVITAMTPDDYEKYGPEKLTSVGRPWANVSIRIVDQDSGRVPEANETGVLEILAARCGPDWIRTTDLGAIDGDGFLYHRGRSDGAIVRGGYKILPDLVAEKIALHPSVATVAVVGLPDARLGEIPVAAVEQRAGFPHVSEEELRAHAVKHLQRTHVPVHFRVVDELPRTQSMKVHLPGVRALFGEASGST